MWNLISVCLEIVLVSEQDRCMVCAKCTIGSESFWTPTKVLLGDKDHVEARFYLFVDSANLYTRWMLGLGQTYHGLRNHFGCNRWNSQVTLVVWNLILVCSETVLVWVQDRCTVCARCTIGSEIILDAPNDTPSWWGSSGSSIQSVWR
jgi:hypothetical protein